MPEQYEQQRVEKRREEDRCRVGHCSIHDNTIADISTIAIAQASQKSESTTIKWVVGLGLPLLVMMVAFFYNSYKDSVKAMSDHQDKISTSVESVKTMVQAVLVNNATTSLRLDGLENDVKDLKLKIEGGRR